MNNELYHHGILGMKWGVRRYQNSDGSLTAEGRKRQIEKNKSKIGYAKEALSVAKEDHVSKRIRQEENEIKVQELTESFVDEVPTKRQSKKLESLFKEWDQLASETDKAYGNVIAIESYIKTLSGIPIDDDLVKHVNRGHEYVSNYISELDDREMQKRKR